MIRVHSWDRGLGWYTEDRKKDPELNLPVVPVSRGGGQRVISIFYLRLSPSPGRSPVGHVLDPVGP